jgi:predicted nucleic acid-binding protein
LTGKLLIDTGPIVAIMLESDEHHEICVEQLRQIKGTLGTCWPVITEAAWLLRACPEAIRRFPAFSMAGRLSLFL